MHSQVDSPFRNTLGQDRLLATPSFWRRRKSMLLPALGVFFLVGLLLPSLTRVLDGGSAVSASRVRTAVVELGPFVRDFAAEGKVVAAGSPTLYAPVAGTVDLHVAAGDVVTSDTVVAVLDSPELNARLEAERASLEAQTLDLQRERLEIQRANTLAKQKLEQARLLYQSAHREYERSRAAYERGAYAAMLMARAQDELELATLALHQAEDTASAQVAQSQLEIGSREALWRRQQLTVQELERQAAATILRAPVSGQIGQVLVLDRENVGRDTPLLSVIDLSRLMVEIQAPESFVHDLMPGMEAELNGNGGSWRGRVESVSPEVVNGLVTARVAFLEGQPTGLRQNQRLSVRVLLEQRENVLSVERGGVFDRNTARVFRVADDGNAERVPVRLGATSLSRVEILQGLSAGDRIVISGTEAFEGVERVTLDY